MIEVSIIIIIIFLGFYGMVVSHDLIKSIIFLNIIEASIILFFISIFNIEFGNVPILNGIIGGYVDPLPQALMITTIVIGASVTSLTLMMSIKVYHQYGTLNWKKLLEMEDE